MKKTIMLMAGITLCVLSNSAHAQTENPVIPASTWDAKKNPTVDSITAQYKEKYIAPLPELTTADFFPVLGEYESAGVTTVSKLTISLDPENKGLVWIEGLPQGKIKAMLRKSPATYKIPAQKNEEGKDVAEGTLIFDKASNTLHICIGKEYNAAEPGVAFLPAAEEPAPATAKKTKTKKTTVTAPWIYLGTKVDTNTVMN